MGGNTVHGVHQGEAGLLENLPGKGGLSGAGGVVQLGACHGNLGLGREAEGHETAPETHIRRQGNFQRVLQGELQGLSAIDLDLHHHRARGILSQKPGVQDERARSLIQADDLQSGQAFLLGDQSEVLASPYPSPAGEKTVARGCGWQLHRQTLGENVRLVVRRKEGMRLSRCRLTAATGGEEQRQ
jgi:hypothetical protein